jgi:hypothetical protein
MVYIGKKFEEYFDGRYYYEEMSVNEDVDLEVTADNTSIDVRLEGDLDREKADKVRRELDSELEEIFADKDLNFTGFDLMPGSTEDNERLYNLIHTFDNIQVEDY